MPSNRLLQQRTPFLLRKVAWILLFVAILNPVVASSLVAAQTRGYVHSMCAVKKGGGHSIVASGHLKRIKRRNVEVHLRRITFQEFSPTLLSSNSFEKMTWFEPTSPTALYRQPPHRPPSC